MVKPHKKHRWIFPLLLVLYAIAFLSAAYYGLTRLWDYLEVYEASRPHHPLNSYIDQLTPEYVADQCQSLIETIDHQVQSEEDCRQVILQALSDGITCTKKSSECTDDYQLFILKCGKKTIGSMEMRRQGEERYSLIPWEVTGDSFDLSFLITEENSITVPSNYPVLVNGNILTDAYITEADIPYDALSPFYSQYSLPTMVTYTAGPFLGESIWEVTDPQGNPVELEADSDPNRFLDNCTSEEQSALDAIVDSYIRSYVDFMSCTGNNTEANYRAMLANLVPGGELAKRMHAALDGLTWVSDRGAVTSSITVHRYVNIGDNRYLCDVTYAVDTRDLTGPVQAVNNLKIILLSTENGLKAETVINY